MFHLVEEVAKFVKTIIQRWKSQKKIKEVKYETK